MGLLDKVTRPTCWTNSAVKLYTVKASKNYNVLRRTRSWDSNGQHKRKQLAVTIRTQHSISQHAVHTNLPTWQAFARDLAASKHVCVWSLFLPGSSSGPPWGHSSYSPASRHTLSGTSKQHVHNTASSVHARGSVVACEKGGTRPRTWRSHAATTLFRNKRRAKSVTGSAWSTAADPCNQAQAHKKAWIFLLD